MDTPEKLEVDDPRNAWAKFYTYQGLTIANLLDGKVMKVLDGLHVIGIQISPDIERDPPHLVCADDKPVFRIRTFGSFAEARRFMSSLVLRGVNAKMRVFKIDEHNKETF